MKIARVSAEYRASYDVLLAGQLSTASLRGHFHDGAGESFPKVGDFVSVTDVEPGKVIIEAIEPRRNVIARIAPHDGTVQVMVTNIDYLLIVMGLDSDFSIARLERYLALAAQSEVSPVIVLNKLDVAITPEDQLAAVAAVAPNVPTLLLSAATGAGVDGLTPFIGAGKTVVLLGSSGAGKSTLTNRLLAAAIQPTNTLRTQDGRGRHTTTHRQLFILPTGGHLIDTPGMRELALLNEELAAADAFLDIDVLATQCRFNNCDHVKSVGCALVAARDSGTLSGERYDRYLKLKTGEERVRRVRY